MIAPDKYKYRNLAAALRLRDQVRLHQAVLSKDEILRKRFMAVRLADGGSDGVAYETSADAIRHNTNNPSRCFYPQIPLERWSAETCDVLLWYVTTVYNNGYREDPAHALMLPTRIEDL